MWEEGPAKNLFGQKRGPAKTISDKKKWSGHSRTGQTADDGLAFSYHLSLISLFCLLLSGHLRQVILYASAYHIGTIWLNISLARNKSYAGCYLTKVARIGTALKTDCWSWFGSEPLDPLIVFLEETFKKLIFEKSADDNKSVKN